MNKYIYIYIYVYVHTYIHIVVCVSLRQQGKLANDRCRQTTPPADHQHGWSGACASNSER